MRNRLNNVELSELARSTMNCVQMHSDWNFNYRNQELDVCECSIIGYEKFVGTKQKLNTKKQRKLWTKRIASSIIMKSVRCWFVPLTLSSDAYASEPAKFSAMHFMMPRCSFSTDPMFKTLDFADNLLIVMPFSPDIIGSLFSVHFIWMGKSPLTIIHETPVLSPVLNDSSPNVNGIICGRTIYKVRKKWKNCTFQRKKRSFVYFKVAASFLPDDVSTHIVRTIFTLKARRFFAARCSNTLRWMQCAEMDFLFDREKQKNWNKITEKSATIQLNLCFHRIV